MKNRDLIQTMTPAEIDMLRLSSTFALTAMREITPLMPGECMAYKRVYVALKTINRIVMKKGASAATDAPDKKPKTKTAPLYIDGARLSTEET